ncbi:MAG: hypothetical protein O3A88_01525, partial [Proteobacteria bacterium]|nr:hypothetical protein [Pseudomonadota bacterium]
RGGLNHTLCAKAFARDKAVCAFSGVSVWMLDYGASQFVDHDWPDHIKPVSRGGGHIVEKLVCASTFHNMKKRNNGNDTAYFFVGGRPTWQFFWSVGRISREQILLLRSHQGIKSSDWYFNRALANMRIAHVAKYCERTPVCTTDYWVTSALRHLVRWKESAKKNDLRRSGLVHYKGADDVKLMLSLADCDHENGLHALKAQVFEIHDALYPYFRANSNAMHAFVDARTHRGRSRVVDRAVRNRFVTEPTRRLLSANLNVLRSHEGPTSVDCGTLLRG